MNSKNKAIKKVSMSEIIARSIAKRGGMEKLHHEAEHRRERMSHVKSYKEPNEHEKRDYQQRTGRAYSE